MLELSQVETNAPISCRQIAETHDMPERFLLQILRSLVTHGILTSSRGVDGGYTLNRPAEAITLLDLFEALEGPVTGSVPTGRSLSEPIQAQLRHVCEEIAAVTRAKLQEITLADLAPARHLSNRVGVAPRPNIVSLIAPELGAHSAGQAIPGAHQHD